MKKNKNIFTIALILGLVTVFLIYRTRKGTIKEELYDFAVSDTAAITKIFLANKKNNALTIERKSNSRWMLNGKYNVRPGAIQTLLATIKTLAVKTRVAKAGYNGVIKGLAAEGIKCEIYQHGEDKPMKVYYVGGSTADVLGTFMLLENSDLPFVTEIPGFQGYLTPRYSPLEEDWRDRAVFDYRPEEIKKVTINYFRDPSKSFAIEQKENHYEVFSPESGKKILHVDTVALFNYLTYFDYVCFEGWDKEFTPRQLDSLKLTTPLNSIAVTGLNGKTNTMITYPKPLTESSLAQTDSSGKPLKYDMDRLCAFINDGSEFVLIQYYVFGKLFRQFNDFDLDRRKPVKK